MTLRNLTYIILKKHILEVYKTHMQNENVFYTTNQYPNLTDEQIVSLIKQGDEKALSYLLEKYKNLVNIKVGKYFIIGAEREDIMQEGMIGLFKAIKNFKEEKQNTFKSFANICIERQLITAIKSSNRQKHMPLNSYLSLNTAAYDNNEEDSVELIDTFDSKTIEDPLETVMKKEYYQEIENAVNKSLSKFEKQVLDRFMKGERSGNRGCCAQPCRLKYSLLKGNSVICTDYLLSPKDIMTAPIINELIHAGINTFKIEGRMKSSEYVALVTKTYRKYIDLSLENNFKPNGNDIKKLTQIFNRGGDSSEGYLKTWSGKSMISKSPKSSGILVGKVENYNRKTENISIKLYEDIISGDGIEIWTEKEPHIGTNISKPALAGDTITLKIKGSTKKGDLVYKSYDKQLNDELKKDLMK